MKKEREMMKVSEVQKCIEIASEVCSVSTDDIMSKSRKATICDARCYLWAYMRLFKSQRYQDIGSFFDRDHSTIVSAVDTFCDLVDSSPKFLRYFNLFVFKIKCNESNQAVKA